MKIAHPRSSIIEKIAARQGQQITQQFKNDSQELLVKTGKETVITEIPSAGYCINDPGKYVLGNTIKWLPEY